MERHSLMPLRGARHVCGGRRGEERRLFGRVVVRGAEVGRVREVNARGQKGHFGEYERQGGRERERERERELRGKTRSN